MPVDPPASKQTQPEQCGNISDQEQLSHISDEVFQQWSNLGFPDQAFCEEAPMTPERQTQYQQEDKEAKEVPEDCFPFEQTIGRVWKLARDFRGSRQVQYAFENGSDAERKALTSELMGRVWEALKCPHANHVIQKCISTISPLSAQFVIDELLQREGGVTQAARHRFGCRVIQRLLAHCGAEQVSPMVEELLADVASLSSHTYGNFVVQHLLEHCGDDVVSRITFILELMSQRSASVLTANISIQSDKVCVRITNLAGSIVRESSFPREAKVVDLQRDILKFKGGEVSLFADDGDEVIFSPLDVHGRLTVWQNCRGLAAADGFIGSVIAKALSLANNEGSRSLATTLLQDPESLAVMACSRYGHDAIKQALQLTDDLTRNKACAELHWRSQRLNLSRYGRQVADFASNCRLADFVQSWQATLSN